MFVPRRIATKLLRLVRTFPAVAVTGARQTGKTTLLLRLFGDRAEHIVFDPIVDVGRAREDPELFLANHNPPLILDEIQYAPQLASSLKRKVDRESRKGRYLITGSQQWNVMKLLAESLAGRVGFVDLDAFSLQEVHRGNEKTSWLELWLKNPQRWVRERKRLHRHRVKLYQHIWKGSLPEAHLAQLKSIPDFWKAYERTYIERDVRQMAEISNLALFTRFFRLVAALTAQEINYSELGREIGVTPQTSQRWLSILQSSFQWYAVPAYSRNSIKKVSERPKGHFGDTGLVCHALAISTPGALESHPAWGAIFESAVYGELRKLSGAMDTPPHVYHWRAHSGAEIDFVLERDGMLYPIEAKGKQSITRHDVKGLKAFREAFPREQIAPGLIIAPVEEIAQITENDYVVPWDLVG
ncbi:MAG TPA: ATP-binding protein [Bdellovibrionota bacterium]|nr:ATP-binding protein [Bdellovibrionota bacterium]